MNEECKEPIVSNRYQMFLLNLYLDKLMRVLAKSRDVGKCNFLLLKNSRKE